MPGAPQEVVKRQSKERDSKPPVNVHNTDNGTTAPPLPCLSPFIRTCVCVCVCVCVCLPAEV